MMIMENKIIIHFNQSSGKRFTYPKRCVFICTVFCTKSEPSSRCARHPADLDGSLQLIINSLEN